MTEYTLGAKSAGAKSALDKGFLEKSLAAASAINNHSGAFSYQKDDSGNVKVTLTGSTNSDVVTISADAANSFKVFNGNKKTEVTKGDSGTLKLEFAAYANGLMVQASESIKNLQAEAKTYKAEAETLAAAAKKTSSTMVDAPILAADKKDAALKEIKGWKTAEDGKNYDNNKSGGFKKIIRGLLQIPKQFLHKFL